MTDAAPGRWVVRGGVRRWIGPRPDDEPLHKIPAMLDTNERIAKAVGLIHAAVRYANERERARHHAAMRRVCCDMCGCLVLADEICPGCRAARQEAA